MTDRGSADKRIPSTRESWKMRRVKRYLGKLEITSICSQSLIIANICETLSERRERNLRKFDFCFLIKLEMMMMIRDSAAPYVTSLTNGPEQDRALIS